MTELGDIISRTYISPIRTVVALDDEFPTLDSLVGEKVRRKELSYLQNDKASELLKYCRTKHWLVDFHNGRSKHSRRDSVQIAKKLRQTDLLILDYKLEGEAAGGKQAIDVIKELCSNKHFNIVVVYTKEDIKTVFEEITLSLWRRADFPQLTKEQTGKIEELFAAWRDEEAAAVTTLEDMIDVGAYRQFRNVQTLVRLEQLEGHAGIKSACGRIRERIQARKAGIKVLDCALWLLERFERTHIMPKLTEGLPDAFVTSVSSEGANWIRGETVFVTVVPKSFVGKEIIDSLCNALVAWRPTAQRVAISRLRADLEANGSAVEERALKDVYLQVGLLRSLAKSDRDLRKSELQGLIERHWSEILSEIGPEALKDAERIIQLELKESGNDIKKLLTSHFRYSWYAEKQPDLEEKIHFSMNEYYSAKRALDGWHLSTGHILQLGQEYWLCLSPLCDMVPSQGQKRWIGALGGYRAFTAVRLYDADKTEALRLASSGLYLFLAINGQTKYFKFVQPGGGEANPDWAVFFVAKQGKFGYEALGKGLFELTIRRVEALRKADDPPKWSPPKLTKAQKVRVVAQLRYEYALNLLQRLGANLSRVGLEFTSVPKP